MKKAVRLLVQGRVQGVGFRWFVLQSARDLRLTGWVRNLADGNVEVYAEGSQSEIDELIEQVKKGPAFSRVQHVVIEWRAYRGAYDSFDVTY